MSNPAPPAASVAPALPPTAVKTPRGPAPRARRMGRAAAIAALVVLIGLGAWLIGVQARGSYQLRAARDAVDRYHNRQAKEQLEAYLSVWPNDPAALLLAARTSRRTGEFERAESLLAGYEAVRGKDDEDLILERVLLEAQRGRVDRVNDYCEARVRENHPSAPLVLEAQTAGLLRLYRIVEADERLETWLKLRPDDCQALLFRGILFDLQSNLSQAEVAYRRVVELDPDNEEARFRLTALLLQAHEPADALPHLQYLQRVLPDDSRVLTQLAKCLAEMGRPDEAKKLLDGVLARDPHFPDALDERGSLALQDGDLAAAEGWLREAVARDPGATETRYHLYRCLAAEGKDAEAQEEDARLKALDIDLKEIQDLVNGKMQRSPHDPALHTRAGEIALRAGAAEDGVRWLESALEIDPNYAPAHEALARYYQIIGDRGRAAEHLAAAGRKHP